MSQVTPHEAPQPILHQLGLLSRRRLLRRVLCSAAGLPLLGASAFLPGQLLAATEGSPETENNWEGPFYKPGAPVRSVLLEKGMAGTPLTVAGRILDTQGRPLNGAPPDFWRAKRTTPTPSRSCFGAARDSNSARPACPRFSTPRAGSRKLTNGWCCSTTPGANPSRPPSGERNWPRSSRLSRQWRRKGRSNERNRWSQPWERWRPAGELN